MKKSLLVLMLTSTFAFATTSPFFYTEGSLKGKNVEHTGYLGYEPACYKGNPWKARNVLKEMALEDIEKNNIKVWYNKESKNIDFIFVDSKCMDDSLDATESECTVEITITKC